MKKVDEAEASVFDMWWWPKLKSERKHICMDKWSRKVKNDLLVNKCRNRCYEGYNNLLKNWLLIDPPRRGRRWRRGNCWSQGDASSAEGAAKSEPYRRKKNAKSAAQVGRRSPRTLAPEAATMESPPLPPPSSPDSVHANWVSVVLVRWRGFWNICGRNT